jgi:transcriptional regulator with XRE-family HTH domain
VRQILTGAQRQSTIPLKKHNLYAPPQPPQYFFASSWSIDSMEPKFCAPWDTCSNLNTLKMKGYKALRFELGVSQEQMAAMMGMTRSNYSRAELGLRNLRFESSRQSARLFFLVRENKSRLREFLHRGLPNKPYAEDDFRKKIKKKLPKLKNEMNQIQFQLQRVQEQKAAAEHAFALLQLAGGLTNEFNDKQMLMWDIQRRKCFGNLSKLRVREMKLEMRRKEAEFKIKLIEEHEVFQH